MHLPLAQAKNQLGLGGLDEAIDEDPSAGLQVDFLAKVGGIQIQYPG